MRVIELSNHPADMLGDVSRQRAAGPPGPRRRWWTWLRRIFTGGRDQRRAPGPAAGTTDLEAKIRAGIEGEQHVAADLGRALDDDWTLLRGYRNRRGEIDDLLLGPRGLFAIEVKNLNATVYVDGDRWRADKYDNYGNLVEQHPIADRKGRSPSEQVNEPADDLERFLGSRGQPVPVQRVVVLAHRRSRLGAVRRPTVLVGASTGYLLALIRDPAQRPLGQHQLMEIQRLIARDHDFHNQRRRPARRPPR